MKSINNYISESSEALTKVRVAFLGFVDEDGIPIPVEILVPRKQLRNFDKFAENEEGNIFEHYESNNIEY